MLGSLFSVSIALTLSPGAGPVGTTVDATGSGLPSGSRVFLYLQGKTPGDGAYYFLDSEIVGQDGKFLNPVSFLVPQANLGSHTVAVSSVGFGPDVASIPGSDIVGAAQFKVTSLTGAGPGIANSSSELSPLSAWGIFSIVIGLAIAGLSILLKPGKGPIEPPEGHRFCLFCSTPVPNESERCPHCNGLQPKS